MSEDDNHVKVKLDMDLPPWFRAAMRVYGIPVLLFLAGNGTAGAILHRSVTRADVIAATREAVKVEVEPLKVQFAELRERQEAHEAADAVTEAAIVKRLPPVKHR